MLKSLVGHVLQARRAAGFRAFEARCADLRKAQETLLLRLVRRNGHTALARRLGADRVRSLDDLQRLPLTDYDAITPEVDGALAGAPDQLVAGRPPFFAITSGTTGRAKHLPIDEPYRAEFQGPVQHFLYGIVRDHPDALAHHALYLAGPARVATSPGGAAIGTISGWNLRRLPRLLRGFYAVPSDVFDLGDAAEQAYAVARFALARELSIAFAVTTAPLALVGRAIEDRFEDLVRDVHDGTLALDHPLTRPLVARLRPDPTRARELTRRAGTRPLPRTLWPTMRLIACWHHASAGSHLAELRERWGDVPIRPAIYSATEAWMNVPLEDAAPERVPAGVLACDAVVLELMRDGVSHLAHAVPGPGRYEVVLTSGAGLWRYRLGDEVDVVGPHLPGQAPRFAFAQKAGNVLSLAHDMTTESHVRAAVARTLPDGSRWVFGPAPTARRYRLVIAGAAPNGALATELDLALRAANLGYDLDRNDGLIDPIELVAIPTEAMTRWEASRGPMLAQSKAVVFVKRPEDLPPPRGTW